MNQLKLIVNIIDDKKGEDINIIDMRNVASLSSYYVICSVNSERQATAIAHEIEKELINQKLQEKYPEDIVGKLHVKKLWNTLISVQKLV